jgi:hypothetical protein
MVMMPTISMYMVAMRSSLFEYEGGFRTLGDKSSSRRANGDPVLSNRSGIVASISDRSVILFVPPYERKNF